MLYLLRKDFKELFEGKKRIVIISAVLIILIISTYYNTTNYNVTNRKAVSGNQIAFGVADEDSTLYSKMLIEYFKESESFASYVHVIEGNSRELEQSFYNGELDLFLKIPEGFVQKMIYLEHPPVEILISTADVTKAILLKNIMDSYEKYIRAVEVNCAALYNTMKKAGMEQDIINKKNMEISYDLIFTALGKEKFFQYREINEFPHTTLLNYYRFAFLSVILNFMGLYVGFQMMKEKRLGILKRLYTVGLGGAEILAEKILFSVCFIFTALSLSFILPYIYKENIISLKLELILFSASLFVISFAVFLSGIFHKIQNYMIAGNFLCFIFSIIGGGIIPVIYLPKTMVRLSAFTPNYWLIRVMLSVEKGMSVDLFYKIILCLLLGSLIFYCIGIRLYGRKEVYYEE